MKLNLPVAVEESVDWRFPRLVCAVRGHQVVRHVTEARLRGWSSSAMGYDIVAWYHQCSRCEHRWPQGTLPPRRRRWQRGKGL